MSGTNSTIQDDNLTFVTYSAGWIFNSSDARYNASNFHATTRSGDTLTMKFQGTWVEVTGAKKPAYGSYSVELDGRLALKGSSLSATDAFRQTLFRLQGLQDGPHAMRMINTGAGFDVDTFAFTSPPKSTASRQNKMNIAVGAALAVIGVLALSIIFFLLRRMRRSIHESKGPYGGPFSDTATLVQAHPYDYVSPYDPANLRSSMKSLPAVPAPAFTGSPVSVDPPSTLKNTYATSDSDHSHTSLPYLANDEGRPRSATIASQSSTSSNNTINVAQQPPVTHSTPSVYVYPNASVRPVRPLSIAGQPGSIRQFLPESPFDSRRVTALYSIQPTIREYSKRDTIFGKRSMDERGRIDLLSEGVPGSPSVDRTEFAFPRPAPRPPMNHLADPPRAFYASPPQLVPDRKHPPPLTLNTSIGMLPSINESRATPLTDEDASSLSTIRFATSPNSGVTQAPSSVPSRSNSNGESLLSPTSDKEKHLSTSTKSKSQKSRRRSSLLPFVPPLPPVPEPEPEPEPTPYVPLAPPPSVAVRHRRAAGSLESIGSAAGVAAGVTSSAFNSPTLMNHSQPSVGLPNSPRPVRVPSPLRLQARPSTLALNADDATRSKMRVVDLESGIVGIVEEKRGWARVRSMMGVVGETNKDEALFEIVAKSPTLISPVQGKKGQRYGQWRTPGPRVAWPGTIGGPRERNVLKPAPLALGGLSNFEPPRSSTAKHFAYEDVIVTGKSTPAEVESRYGRKKMSILQSAILNGRANKEEVEFVTGIKMNI